MRRLLTASFVAVAGAATLTGCLGDDDRGRVETYLEQVNELQSSTPGYEQAAPIYRRVVEGKVKLDRAASRLETAERSIAAVLAGLDDLDPPAIAEPLHDLLVRAFELNAGMASETTRFARFVPRNEKAAAPLERANRLMNAGLQSADAATQARALDRFASTVGEVIKGLERLTPPPVLARSHRARIEKLNKVRSLALELRGALKRQDGATVARLLTRFGQATEFASDGIDARSVREYERRYRRLDRVTRQVRAEQSRLRRKVLELEQ